jgi:hypothetical protein
MLPTRAWGRDSLKPVTPHPSTWRRPTLRGLACLLLAVGLSALLNACGGGTSGTPVAATQPQAASAGQTHAATATTTTPTATAPIPTQPATRNFVDSASTTQGDRLSVEGRVGPLVRPGEAGVPSQQSLGECPGLAGRERFIRIELAATIDSSLAGTVELTVPQPGNINFETPIEYLNESGERVECATTQNADTMRINLGSLQPHQQSQFATLWVIVVEAVTPKDSTPTSGSLAKRGLVLGGITGSINGNGAITNVAASGQASRVCGGSFERADYIAVVPITCSQIEMAQHGEHS